jgi:transmembrane sensor
MPDTPKPRDFAADQQAADWVARRDRGLSGAEQDEYLQWLGEDPRRAALVARHEGTVRLLQRLQHWQPASSSEPNPDLFAQPRMRRRRWVAALAACAAMAAVLVVGATVFRPAAKPPLQLAPASTFLRHNERQVLTDGSIVELRDGSRIEIVFSAQERRVRLRGGEAHFTVAKNPAWPFVVEADRVTVHAVGTAFAVRLDATEVDVVVTEGRVRVEPAPVAGPAETPAAAVAAVEAPVLSASERVLVSLAAEAPAPKVMPVTTAQMREALAWQAPRFQFFETPLAEAVAEFNRRNRQQVVLGDAGLAAVPIGGTFRVDNVDGFVSLLELTLGVRAERRGNGPYVLTRAR